MRLITFILFLSSLSSFAQQDSTEVKQISFTKKDKLESINFSSEVRVSNFKAVYIGYIKEMNSDGILLSSERDGEVKLEYYDIEYIQVRRHPIRFISGSILKTAGIITLIGGTASGLGGTISAASRSDISVGTPVAFVLIPIGLLIHKTGSLVCGKKYRLDKWEVLKN